MGNIKTIEQLEQRRAAGRAYYRTHKEDYVRRGKAFRDSYKKELGISYHTWYGRMHPEKKKVYSAVWVKKHGDDQRLGILKRKLKYIEMLGGKCEICGEARSICLDFHHKDPKFKENKGETRTNDFVIRIQNNEIRLLCANCHRVIHNQNQIVLEEKIKNGN